MTTARRAIAAGFLISAALADEASAQAPTLAPAPPAAPASPPAPNVCTPDHCQHRGIVSRQRCRRRLRQLKQTLGVPQEFEERPLGASLYQINRTQVANGTAGRMIVRRTDFEPGKGTLSLRGRGRLERMAEDLPGTSFPIIVESTAGNPALDDSRRLAVWNELANGPFPIPDERVVVGLPGWGARGLGGYESEAVNRKLLSRFESGGPPLGTSLSAGAPFGAAAAIRPPGT